MQEIFKDIEGYKGKYQVSNLGNVKSLKRLIYNGRGGTYYTNERILKHTVSKGSCHIILCKNSKIKSYTIHGLIMSTFLNYKAKNNKMVIDHIDNNPLNNNINNLQIITNRENCSKDRFRGNYSSKYVGVSLCKKSKKWYSQIYINGKYKNLGRYKNEIDAHLAYQNILKKITNDKN